DVHDHGGDERCDTTGHVETDSTDRHHALLDDSAGRHVGAYVGLEFRRARRSEAADRLLKTGPYVGIEFSERLLDCFGGHAYLCLFDPVELGRVLTDRLDTPIPYVVADRPDHMEGRFDIELRARHGAAVVGAGGT